MSQKSAFYLLGKRVNQVTLEALAQGMQQTLRRRNLRQMPGSWTEAEAKAFEQALNSQRSIDEELWK